MVHSVSSTYGLTVVHSSTTKEYSRTTTRSFYELTRNDHSLPLEATALLSSTSCIILSQLFGIDNNDNKVIPMYNHSTPQ